jgi:uncharacterized protein with HEPN domain
MIRTILARIDDMLEAIDGIRRATADKSFEEFQRDWLLRKGTERGIEIISEASCHLPEDLKAMHPYPRWRHVAGIGNILRHEYHRVEDKIVWTAVQMSCPVSRSALKRCVQGSRMNAERVTAERD